jgi:phenylalanyl-tRNA synthetase alpha chain
LLPQSETDQSGADSIVAQATDSLQRATHDIEAAKSPDALEEVRIRFLGKHGEFTDHLKRVPKVPPEDRPRVGKSLNQIKRELEEQLQNRRVKLEAAVAQKIDGIDVTLPGRRTSAGRVHPLTATAEEMKRILRGLGFSFNDYPEVETEYFNFDSLNTPETHSSRDLHDSFYTDTGHVLRTHTSAFQVRAMRAHKGSLPIRAMTTGRCYRRDERDASHSPVFQQLDGIAAGRDLSMADLKWTLTELAKGLFGPEATIRFRPSYFPFTTPSAEVDVSCVVCRQRGCQLCSRTGWLEVLGSGMTRPEVLRAGGLDPAVCQGFAFGIGVDRITMLRHRIEDIRLLYANEEAFLRQF